MAKHRFHPTPITLVRHLVLAALVLVLGVSLSWGQKAAPGSAAGSKPPAKGRSVKTPAAHQSARETSSISTSDAGKRDPFKLPVVATGKGGPGGESGMESLPAGGVLPAGKRGLIISQLKLEGTVRQLNANKMTAVVADHRKLAYFLHENDSVYNGIVSKITPDSVYFKENVLDSKGHVTTREVVKRLGAAPGEGR